MSAGSQRRALTFCCCVRVSSWHMFLISKCRQESDLSLYTTSVPDNEMQPHTGKFWQILWSNMFVYRESPPCRIILFTSTNVVHRPGSDSILHFYVKNTCQIRKEKWKASIHHLLPADILECGPHVCRVRSQLHYYRRIDSCAQKRSLWNAL